MNEQYDYKQTVNHATTNSNTIRTNEIENTVENILLSIEV